MTCGQEFYFPTNPDLADIFGRTDLDFEKFNVFLCVAFIFGFQIFGFPGLLHLMPFQATFPCTDKSLKNCNEVYVFLGGLLLLLVKKALSPAPASQLQQFGSQSFAAALPPAVTGLPSSPPDSSKHSSSSFSGEWGPPIGPPRNIGDFVLQIWDLSVHGKMLEMAPNGAGKSFFQLI